jgi:RNA-directed DNA polymerase
VKAKTNRATRHLSLSEALVSNRMLRGWANYFRHGVSKRTFGAIATRVRSTAAPAS